MSSAWMLSSNSVHATRVESGPWPIVKNQTRTCQLSVLSQKTPVGLSLHTKTSLWVCPYPITQSQSTLARCGLNISRASTFHISACGAKCTRPMPKPLLSSHSNKHSQTIESHSYPSPRRKSIYTCLNIGYSATTIHADTTTTIGYQPGSSHLYLWHQFRGACCLCRLWRTIKDRTASRNISKEPLYSLKRTEDTLLKLKTTSKEWNSSTGTGILFTGAMEKSVGQWTLPKIKSTTQESTSWEPRTNLGEENQSQKVTKNPK